MPPLNPIFTSAQFKPSKKTTPSPFDQETADFVRKLCVEMNWKPSTGRKVWADQVRLLRQDPGGPSQEDIAQTLARYAAAVKAGKTKFTIVNCKQLRERWEDVKRIAGKMPAQVSPRAVELARQSGLSYKWPKVVTAEDVAAFAQIVLTFAERHAVRVTELSKLTKAAPAKTGMDLSRRGAVAAAVVFGGPDGFVRRYLERVLKEVRAWKDWNGNFDKFLPKLDSPYAGIRKAVLENSNPEAWDWLKKELSK